MHFASSRDTLHLLLLTHKQSDAEDLVSLLRNSGRATRAHMVSSVDDFNAQIQEKSWDLVLAEPKAQNIEPKELFKQIKRLDKDLPVIILAEDVDPMQLEFYLKLGACDVVPEDESNLLSLVIQRELSNLNSRRTLRTTQVKLRDAEKRCQSLLESSKDAITYIHDGMHIYANQAYLDLFGYHTVDDLEGMPVMDMVASRDQENLKQALKSFLASGGNVDLNYNGLKTDETEFPLTMSLSAGTYADEPCTQIVIRASSGNADLEAKLKEVSSRDLLTGLFNKPYYMDQLGTVVDRAVLKGNTSAAIYINLDNYGKIKSKVGINNSDSVLCDVANYLKSAVNKEDTLARVGEDVFAWIRPDINAEQALATAEEFRDGIEHLVIDAHSQTVTITASIGVALINDSCSEPGEILQRAHQAADAVRNDEGHEKGNGVHLYIVEEEAPDNSDDGIEKQVLEALKGNSKLSGKITEIITSDEEATSLTMLLPLRATLSKDDRWFAWVSPPKNLPKALLKEAGIALDKILLLNPDDQNSALKLAKKALSAGTCHAVISWAGDLSEHELANLEQSASIGASHAIVIRRRGH